MRTKAAVITSNAGRHPMSARRRMPGVPKSTCCAMRGREEPGPGPDPPTGDVTAARRDSRGRHGARKIRRAPAKRGEVASRGRITRTTRENSLAGAHTKARSEPHADRPDEAGPPNVLDREFDGRSLRTHLAGDLACVRVPSAWHHTCLPVDPANRGIVGHAAGAREDARLVRSAFATVASPLFDVDVLRSDRGSEFDDMALDEMFEVFGIARSLSKKGRPYDSAVVESANKMLKAEFVYGERFDGLGELQTKLGDYVWWYNHGRMRSTLGHMSPVELREKSLTIMSK